jgi:DNA-binding beta-propeller fold protein YncE
VSLRLEGYIDLPAHRGPGGFDHAAIHRGLRRLYVAHTANDTVDVIDLDELRLVDSIGGLAGVAGALVSESGNRVFTSNRAEDTVGILDLAHPRSIVKVAVGRRPNGLACDPARKTLLAANVGEPDDAASHTLSIVDVERAAMTASIPVAGRTRWTVFDPASDQFFVNIADPPSIVVVAGSDPTRLSRHIEIPAAGPHGLDIDRSGRLFCACDAGRLIVLAPSTYEVLADLPLGGVPDVIFLDQALGRLYVAIGDPGVVEIFDVNRLARVDAVPSERGAHTIALDLDSHRVFAFLPGSARAAVFRAAI